MEYFIELPYYIQALIATIGTWAITALGAAVVFMFKKVNKSILDAMLGFAAGVMIAATFFSLLSPAIEMAESLNMIAWIIVSIGFLAGGFLLFIGDKIFEKIIKKSQSSDNEKSSLKRCLMLISSVTLHNIPDGLLIL